MDVHLREQAAGDPEEVDEVPNLPVEVLLARWPRAQLANRLHPVGADELDLAQLAVAQALDEFEAVTRVAALEARRDLEILLGGGFPGLDDAPQARCIRREGLLHKDVHAFLDGVFELRRAKA